MNVFYGGIVHSQIGAVFGYYHRLYHRPKNIWVDVFPIRHILDRREITRRNPSGGGEMGLGGARPEIIEPQASIERESPDGPLILGKQTKIRFYFLDAFPGSGRLKDGNRLAIPQSKLHILTGLGR